MTLSQFSQRHPMNTTLKTNLHFTSSCKHLVGFGHQEETVNLSTWTVLGAAIAWGSTAVCRLPRCSLRSTASVPIARGPRIDGPWVLGLKQGSDCHYFWVEWRDRNTLIPINEREYVEGLVIHSYELPPYSNRNAIGYQLSTVNHQQHYVDPATGAHTHRQLSDRGW